MQKILLTNKNSVWGVIVNPVGTDKFEHIISFPNKNLRDEFINNELCNGEDYKILIEKQPEQAVVMESSSKASVMVNLNDYPDETMSSMLNKDFAIVKDGNGEYSYWAVTSELSNSGAPNITFDLSLDVFFTYDIKEMFNDNQCEIEQAHEDRFVKKKNKITPMLLMENWDEDKTKGIYLPEKLGENFTLQNNNNNGGIVFYLPQEIKSRIYVESESWKDIIMSVLSTNSTMTICSQIKSSQTFPELKTATKTATKFNGNKQNYITNFFPNEWGIFWKDCPVAPPKQFKISYHCVIQYGEEVGIIPSTNSTYFNYHIQKVDVIGNTLNTSPNNVLFNLLVKDNLKKIDINGTSGDIKVVIEVEKTSTPDVYIIREDEHQVIYFTKEVHDGRGYMIPSLNQYPKSVEFDDKMNTFQARTTYPERGFYTPWEENYELNKNNDKDLNNEIKSLVYPFRQLLIKGSTPNDIYLNPLYLFKNKVEFDLIIAFLMSSYEAVLKINDYNNNHIIDNYDKKHIKSISSNRNMFSNKFNTFYDKANYMGATTKNAWNEYISTRKAGNAMDFKQANWDRIKAGIGFAGSAGATLAAGATGNVMGMLGGVMGLTKSSFDIAQSVLNIHKLQARNNDIKNSPNSTQPTNDDGQINLHLFGGGFTLYDQRMLPQEHILVQEHFYKYGHNFNHKLYKLNNFLSSRYYFNYIKTAGCFELFKLQLSSDLKQLISASLADGIHIWHYRDGKTWGGVKNFTKENVEMNIINNKKRTRYEKNKKNINKRLIKNSKKST